MTYILTLRIWVLEIHTCLLEGHRLIPQKKLLSSCSMELSLFHLMSSGLIIYPWNIIVQLKSFRVEFICHFSDFICHILFLLQIVQKIHNFSHITLYIYTCTLCICSERLIEFMMNIVWRIWRFAVAFLISFLNKKFFILVFIFQGVEFMPLDE